MKVHNYIHCGSNHQARWSNSLKAPQSKNPIKTVAAPVSAELERSASEIEHRRVIVNTQVLLLTAWFQLWQYSHKFQCRRVPKCWIHQKIFYIFMTSACARRAGAASQVFERMHNTLTIGWKLRHPAVANTALDTSSPTPIPVPVSRIKRAAQMIQLYSEVYNGKLKGWPYVSESMQAFTKFEMDSNMLSLRSKYLRETTRLKQTQWHIVYKYQYIIQTKHRSTNRAIKIQANQRCSGKRQVICSMRAQLIQLSTEGCCDSKTHHPYKPAPVHDVDDEFKKLKYGWIHNK